MPQTNDKRRARWPGWDTQAILYLESMGYILTEDWRWKHISDPHNVPTEKEWDAIIYLVEEFDFGGLYEDHR